jgi:hypothetical protein
MIRSIAGTEISKPLSLALVVMTLDLAICTPLANCMTKASARLFGGHRTFQPFVRTKHIIRKHQGWKSSIAEPVASGKSHAFIQSLSDWRIWRSGRAESAQPIWLLNADRLIRCVQQTSRREQIGGVETLGKAVIHRCQHIMRRRGKALLTPQPCQARRRA